MGSLFVGVVFFWVVLWVPFFVLVVFGVVVFVKVVFEFVSGLSSSGLWTVGRDLVVGVNDGYR